MIDKAAIISTGDELVTGRLSHRNASYIADRLTVLGLEVVAILAVGDNKERILWALRNAMELADLIIGTGALGPAPTDLATETVAEYFGRRLHKDEQVARNLRHRIEQLKLPRTAKSSKLFEFPEGSEIIPNPLGTALGFRFSPGPKKTLFWLCGAFKEMEAMFKDSVVPWVRQERRGGERIFTCSFTIYGLTESELSDILKPISLSEKVKLSFHACDADLTVRLTLRGDEQQEELFQSLSAKIEDLIGPRIFREGEESLEERVPKLLLEKGLTLAVAESCTGGYISHRITQIAGSSAYFKSAVVTYSDQAKIDFLGVQKSTLARHGAVSRETALEMAKGIKERAQASIGLSVTGIAGPTGGSPNQPVGTVWIGLAQADKGEARLFRFHGDREHTITAASQAALNWIRTTLQQEIRA